MITTLLCCNNDFLNIDIYFVFSITKCLKNTFYWKTPVAVAELAIWPAKLSLSSPAKSRKEALSLSLSPPVTGL